MKKIAKILLVFALIIATAFSTVACSPDGEGTKKDPGLYYKKTGDYYTITKYVQEEGVTELDLGAIANQKGITFGKINEGVFAGNDTLENVIVPDTVKEIASGAFKQMSKLKKITLPFVGKNADSDAYYLESGSRAGKAVDAERTFAYIFGTENYEGASYIYSDYGNGSPVTYYVSSYLTEVTIKNSTAYSIPMNAFNNVKTISKINLEGNIDAIGSYAFCECFALTSINIPNTVKSIYDYAFDCADNLTSITFQEESTLEYIGKHAFCSSKVSSIVLPETLKTIDDYAFENSKLESITLSRDLETIGIYGFYNCEKLETVNVASVSGTVVAKNSAFENCKLLDSSTISAKMDISNSQNVFKNTKA